MEISTEAFFTWCVILISASVIGFEIRRLSAELKRIADRLDVPEDPD
jgi:hypothetical protein